MDSSEGTKVRIMEKSVVEKQRRISLVEIVVVIGTLVVLAAIAMTLVTNY